MTKTLKTIFTISGLLTSIILMMLEFLKYNNLGFPDGHLSEYDVFLQEKLMPIFFVVNGVFLFLFLFKNNNVQKSLIIYALFLVLYFMASYYFGMTLENGQGG